MFHADDNGVLTRERRLPGEHFVADTGQGVLVTSPAGKSLELFGGHIKR